MNASEIERARQLLATYVPGSGSEEHRIDGDKLRELCELALDGLRFQMCIKLASERPASVAVEIAKCITPNQYRAAIDRLIVEEARR